MSGAIQVIADPVPVITPPVLVQVYVSESPSGSETEQVITVF